MDNFPFDVQGIIQAAEDIIQGTRDVDTCTASQRASLYDINAWSYLLQAAYEDARTEGDMGMMLAVKKLVHNLHASMEGDAC